MATETKSKATTSAETGTGIGMVIAAIMSWAKVHSILWCLFHGALGWSYVLFHAFKGDY